MDDAIKTLAKAILMIADKAAVEEDVDNEQYISTGILLDYQIEQKLRKLAEE